MNKNNSTALLSLLKDPDNATFEAIADSLTLDIPALEDLWRQADDETALSRLDWLLQRARFNQLEKALTDWQKNGALDIIEGAWLLATSRFPDLSFSEVDDAIANMVKDAWLELNDDMTPRETVETINRVLFVKHGLRADPRNMPLSDNIFINDVLRSKKGWRSGLAIIYLGVAQKLGLPVFASPLPFGIFISWTNNDVLGKNVVFYIDPFNKGKILDEAEILNYINKHEIPYMPEFFFPSSNDVAIQMLMIELIMLYHKEGLDNHAQLINQLIQKFQEWQNQA
jgi:hypothetical protein